MAATSSLDNEKAASAGSANHPKHGSGSKDKHAGKTHFTYSKVLHVISIIVLIVSAAAIAIALFATRVSVADVLRFVLLLVFYVTLPGYVLSRLTTNRKSLAQIVAFSITFSVAFLIASYFLDELVIKQLVPGLATSLQQGLQSFGATTLATNAGKGTFLGFFAPPILAIVSLALLIGDIRNGSLDKNSLKLDIRLVALTAATMLIAFFSIYMRISTPVDSMGITKVYFDTAWLTSNDASFALGWPADGFQYDGKHLNSNCFANLFRAAMTRASGFSSAEMYGACATFITIPFCIASIQALGERCFKNTNKALFATFAFVFVRFFSAAGLFFYNLDKAFAVAREAYFYSAMTNILYSPNGIDLAIPVIAVMSIILLDFLDAKRPQPIQYVALFISAALLTGAKYVFPVCVLGALGGTIVFRLVLNKKLNDVSLLIKALAIISVAFLLIYTFVVRGGEVYEEPTAVEPTFSVAADRHNNTYEQVDYEYTGQYSGIQIGVLVAKSKLFRDVKTVFYIPDKANTALAIVLMPIHFILQQLLVALPFLIWLFTRFRRLRETTVDELVLGGIAVFGVVVYYILNVNGNSQAYFFFCASLFVNLIGAGWLYDHYDSLNRIWKIVVVLCMIIALASTAVTSIDYSKRGVLNLYNALDANREESVSDYDCITDYEYEAMIWLRDNTESDAVIAVDRHYIQYVPNTVLPEPDQYASRYYYYTAYCERQSFIGSWAYMPRTAEMQQQLIERLKTNEALYSVGCLNRREIMEGNGISYLVLSRFEHPYLNLEDPDLQVVFENRDITIYALS